MKDVAKGLASLGRGRDTMLVHMSPREVAGLQTLAMATGGSLTINPHTGLHEAGWLESILPMVAGGALTVMSGGTLSPLMAAAITGGGTGLVTGDWEKGLMAGLGAFGGASLGAGIAGAGADVTAQAAAEAAAANAAPQASIAGASGELGSSALGAGENLLTRGTAEAAKQAEMQAAQQAAAQQAATASGKAAQGWQNFKTGLGTLDSGQGWMNLYNQPTMGMKGSAAAALPVMSAMNQMDGAGSYKEDPAQYWATSYSPGEQLVPGQGYLSGQGYYGGHWTTDPKEATRTPSRSGSWAGAEGGVPGSSNMQDYYASLLMPAASAPAAPPSPDAMNAYLKRTSDLINAPPQPTRTTSTPGWNSYTSNDDIRQLGLATGNFGDALRTNLALGNTDLIDWFDKKFDISGRLGRNITPTTPSAPNADVNPGAPNAMAGGGIAALAHGGTYNAGGKLLRGPGDGVSDSIPAIIKGPQPQRAALADGEFVFPARIVSEIGNGSTEAGARKLYAVMDKIQQDRMQTAKRGGIAANTNALRHFKNV